jgi:hypothetical protein
VNTFLQAIRRHGWDTSLPPSAMFFPEDYPKGDEKLPCALAEHVMAQVEDPANLARQGNPAYRLITIILIRCGLRVSDATGLPFDCVVRDADCAPYLRYYNRKMKREALVPIDDISLKGAVTIFALLYRYVHQRRQRAPQPMNQE